MKPLIEVRDLKKHFAVNSGVFSRGGGVVHAVDGVSFHIDPSVKLWDSSAKAAAGNRRPAARC